MIRQKCLEVFLQIDTGCNVRCSGCSLYKNIIRLTCHPSLGLSWTRNYLWWLVQIWSGSSGLLVGLWSSSWFIALFIALWYLRFSFFLIREALLRLGLSYKFVVPSGGTATWIEEEPSLGVTDSKRFGRMSLTNKVVRTNSAKKQKKKRRVFFRFNSEQRNWSIQW